MEIRLMRMEGLPEALFGIGLSYGLTSEYEGWDDVPFDRRMKLQEIASKLCKAGAGEDKFLRQVVCWWDVRAPRYWWAEADTFKVGTVAQSESTMHTIMRRPLGDSDFEKPVHPHVLENVNLLVKLYRDARPETKQEWFLDLKNVLPEGFLQRRIWMLNLANMKNIHRQRKNHRLPQWHAVCDAFVEATPGFLTRMYE